MGRVIGEITGSNAMARTGQRIATAQADSARTQYDRSVADRNEAMRLAAPSSPAEILAAEKALKIQTQNLDRQSALYDALDPAILEASTQALKLLRGEDSSALDPVRKNRAQQRQKLLNSLREQLGPGAETSTAGIQALTQFDLETDNLISGTQQSTLNNLFGMGSAGAAGRGNLGNSAQTLQSIFGDNANRRVNAFTGMSGGVAASGQGLVNTAGSQFTGEMLGRQATSQFNGGLLNTAIMAGTSYALGGKKGLTDNLVKDTASSTMSNAMYSRGGSNLLSA